MPPDRDTAYLLDILIHARDARQFTSSMDFATFRNDVKTQYAVIRCLEVIGEAVKRLSDATKQSHAGIPWVQMARMRDFLIHVYDIIDARKVWDTVQNDLPGLISQLEGILPPGLGQPPSV